MKIKKLLNSKQIRVVSFDIFDTLVTRNVATPRCIFESVWIEYAKRVDDKSSMNQVYFRMLREESEQAARDYSEREDVTLSAIYQCVKKSSGLSVDAINRLKEIEVEMEVSSTFPVEESIALLRKVKKYGKRVILTSDMYLDKNVIEVILKKFNIFDYVDCIYLSSEIGLRKVSGALYLHVLECEGVKPNEFSHIGDNYFVDVLRPYFKKQILSYHYKGVNNNRNCRIIYNEKYAASTFLNSTIAGAMKVASLDQRYANEPMFKLGVDFVAPVLVSYVIWIMQIAKERSINKLYFLSRDGYLLYLIACVLESKFKYGFDLRYLYASRQSLHLPSVLNIETDLYDWFVQNADNIELKSISERLNIDVDLFCNELNSLNGYSVSAVSRLDKKAIENIYKTILDSSKLRFMITEAANSKRLAVLNYFEQEGLFDDDRFAFVDLGWSGRMVGSIQRILQSGGDDRNVMCFFWGDNNINFCESSKVETMSYFYGPSTYFEYKEIGVSISHLLEVLCYALHGSVCDFAVSDGKVEPVFKEMENEKNLSDFYHMKDGVMCYIDKLSPSVVNCNMKALRPRLFELIKDFYLSPHKSLAEVLGGLQFSIDQAGLQIREVAPRLTFFQTCKYLLFYFKIRREKFTSWIHASRVRSSWIVNYMLLLSSYLMRGFFYIQRKMFRFL